MTGVERYLVCYDYGTGGIWFWLRADSVEDIRKSYPELEAVAELPSWMPETKADGLDEYDISAAPQGFLNEVVDARMAARLLTGRDRPVFTVGTKWNGQMSWALLRATDEMSIAAKYPELIFRHGRDPEWVRHQRQIGALSSTVFDIDALPAGVPFFEAISGHAP